MKHLIESIFPFRYLIIIGILYSFSILYRPYRKWLLSTEEPKELKAFLLVPIAVTISSGILFTFIFISIYSKP